jgi:uncharacterized damage-inducible protein DinB
MTKDGLERLLDYTVWANHRAMRAAATLSVAEFKRDLGGSYGGVRGTLAHVLGGEWIWLERWKGVSPTKPPFDEAEFKDIVSLRERWKVIEDHRSSWLDGLKADDTCRIIRYKTLAGQPFEAPLWQLVQHVANHSTYHRGQVVTFLRQLGAKPLATDLVVWDRRARK